MRSFAIEDPGSPVPPLYATLPGKTFFKNLKSKKLSKCSALTANNAFAQKRLQKEGIYCLHTKHINLCGGIDVVAFDKVGQFFYLFIETNY